MLHSELFEAHTNKSKAIIVISSLQARGCLRKSELCYRVNSENLQSIDLVASQTQYKD